MADPENCPKCGRRVAESGDHDLQIGACYASLPTACQLDVEMCDATARLNTMTALVRKLLDGPMIRPPQTQEERAQYRAILLVLDSYGGGPRRTACPICSRPSVVVKGVIGVHYRTNVDQRPCPASFKACLAGYLLD